MTQTAAGLSTPDFNRYGRWYPWSNGLRGQGPLRILRLRYGGRGPRRIPALGAAGAHLLPETILLGFVVRYRQSLKLIIERAANVRGRGGSSGQSVAVLGFESAFRTMSPRLGFACITAVKLALMSRGVLPRPGWSSTETRALPRRWSSKSRAASTSPRPKPPYRTNQSSTRCPSHRP